MKISFLVLQHSFTHNTLMVRLSKLVAAQIYSATHSNIWILGSVDGDSSDKTGRLLLWLLTAKFINTHPKWMFVWIVLL